MIVVNYSPLTKMEINESMLIAINILTNIWEDKKVLPWGRMPNNIIGTLELENCSLEIIREIFNSGKNYPWLLKLGGY